MTYLVVILVVGLFIGAFWLSGVVSVANHAMSVSLNALNIIQDSTKNDEEKEKILQRDALTLIRCFFSIFFRGLLVVSAAALPILVSHALNLAEYSVVIDLLESWETIVLSTIFMILVYVLGRRMS